MQEILLLNSLNEDHLRRRTQAEGAIRVSLVIEVFRPLVGANVKQEGPIQRHLHGVLEAEQNLGAQHLAVREVR